MRTASFKIWTRVAVSISSDNYHSTTRTPYFIQHVVRIILKELNLCPINENCWSQVSVIDREWHLRLFESLAVMEGL